MVLMESSRGEVNMKATTKVRCILATIGLTSVGALWMGDTLLAVVKPRQFVQVDSFLNYRGAAPFPERSSSALGGREIMSKIAHVPTRRREAAIYAEIIAGNVPDHLRTLQPVRLSMRDRTGRSVTGTVWVLSDYLAIGSNSDFVRVPMNLETASRLAMHLGMGLPTSKIVDDVYASAQFKLAPDPLTPSAEMTSIRYAVNHDNKIRQRLAASFPQLVLGPDQLIAGHKKDLVMTPRLEQRGDRVAIFGWHRLNGRPIQSLNKSHGRRYADYSHGVRLISATIYADGRYVPLEDALADRMFAPLVSYEGRFSTYATIMAKAAHGGQDPAKKRDKLFASH